MDYDENHNDLSQWVDCNIYGINYCLEKVKLISLISEVLERLPSKDREVIMYQRGVRFIAPITNNSVTEQVFIDPIGVRKEQTTLCRCSKCNEPHLTVKDGRYDMTIGIWLVCLSSEILKRSKKESLYTIAHELAHVYLEIPKTASMIEEFSEKEREVDEQVIKWNFKTELRQKLLGGSLMPNTKRCELCRNPFEPLKDEDHCKGCSRISGLQRFFDTDAESLKNSIERCPQLPITDSVEWRQRVLPERRYFLYPIIHEASITLVAGEDGSGKTMK
jgi:hypothetical protein